MGVTVVSMTSPTKHLAVFNANLTGPANFMDIKHVADQNVTIEDIYGNFTGNRSIDEATLVNSTKDHREVSLLVPINLKQIYKIYRVASIINLY